MSHKLLILSHSTPVYIAALKKLKLPQLKILEKNAENLAQTDIWLAEPHLALPVVPKAKSLTWMQATYPGIDSLFQSSKNIGYELTCVQQEPMALINEYVFSYILAKNRQHYHYRQLQHHRRWQTLPHEPLSNQNTLILGTGRVGQSLCLTAKHFNLNITGVNRNGNCPAPFKKTVSIHKLNHMLPQADIVLCCLPNSKETKLLFNAERLKHLKSTALLINVGNSDLIDYQALLLHLSLHPASQAVLDVHYQEPLKETNPLWQCPNAVITPHIAAQSQVQNVVEQFAENYLRFLKKEPLKYTINTLKGAK
jgi:phosphoglycerate dehydrogenase-like enzyme